VGSSKEDLLAFPEPVQDEIGTALSVAQFGGKHPRAKPWRGEGPGVFEIVEDHRGDTYRTVYTVRFEGVVYVLHAFQKKSSTGIRTSKRDVDLIARRLNEARKDFEVRYGKG
jgi:phage-related protein